MTVPEVDAEKQSSALLLEDLNRKIVQVCIPEARTLSELADLLHTEMNPLHYRVQRLLKAGFLSISHIEKRAGRPIKHYRATQETFFVPFRYTPYEDMASYCYGLTSSSLKGFWESAFQKAQELSGEWGLCMAYSPRRKSFVMQVQREHDARDEKSDMEQWALENHVLGTFDQLHLAPPEAHAMYHELLAVYRKYAQKQDLQARVHWVGLFFAEERS